MNDARGNGFRVLRRQGDLNIMRAGEELHALRFRGMRQHDVGVATPPHRERLPAAHRDHLHAVAGLALEHREQRVEQPGVAGGGRGGEEDFVRLGG